MGIYLLDNPPARSQWKARTRKPTGLIVVHTAENVTDKIGPDTGAEAVAAFIRKRTTPGCYHDLADSDSRIQLAPYEMGCYHDGTGSNPFSLSISFALAAADWMKLTHEQREGFLRNGAHAFANQQAWLRSKGYPTTPVRRVNKVDSTNGAAGLISHGERDPARRSDPGKDFPWDRFMQLCREATGGPAPVPPPPPGTGGAFPTLRRGDKGAAVLRLQEFMVRTFPTYNSYGPNGTFGPATEAGVKEFQRRVGLGDDGVVGPATNGALARFGYRG